ncbi:hypothetical protein [Thalassospira sp. MIT1370]|uniref:hypothetical protein n=1 Tax=unclassified Thalassospira TaxID=2648997 RepID=UPI00399A42AE
MSKENQFSAPTKRTLSERAGFRCSFPGCDRVTIGPNEESDEKSSATGMACHIYSAGNSLPARRKGNLLSKEFLSSPENGIWMCYFHGKQIDTDEKRYSVETLKEWKKKSELSAKLRHERGENSDISRALYEAHPIIPLQLTHTQDEQETLVETIEDFLTQCSIDDLWGKELRNSTQELIFEISTNAFKHGCAKIIYLRSTKTGIVLSTDGEHFSLEQLIASEKGRGGSLCLSSFKKQHYDHVFLNYNIENELNTYTISAPLSASNMLESNHKCSITLNDLSDARHAKIKEFSKTSIDCENIYIDAGIMLHTSNLYLLCQLISESEQLSSKKIIILTKRFSKGLEESVYEIPEFQKLNIKTIETHN